MTAPDTSIIIDRTACPEASACPLAADPRPGEFCSGTIHADGLCFVTDKKPSAAAIVELQAARQGRALPLLAGEGM
mgnify:CR=1 FL=1